jgi:predicted nuclease of predicted toxin-antitoxin system
MRSDAILVTKDEDFAARFAQAETAPVIVWLRVGNTSNRALRAWLEARLPGIVQLAEQGHRLIEVI